MLRFWIVTSSLFVALCGADVDFRFGKDCFPKHGNLELTAEYTGSGTVSAVQWYYSGQVGSNLVIIASTCTIFGAVDAGYPDTSRMTFTCPTSTKFTLTLTDIQTDELEKSWGATFTLASGPSPTVAEEPIPVCAGCPEDCKIRVIVGIVFGILGILALAGVIIGIVTNCFNNPVCLAVDVLGFVFDIISLGLSASVVADDKDSEDWIHNSAIAFVVIPPIVAVTAIVIIILVCLGVVGQGGNGITKKDLRPSKETVCEKLLRVLESAYPRILLVKDLIRKVDAEESVVMEQLEELKRKDLIRQLDSGGFVRHFLDVKTGITKQDLRPLEEIVCEKLLHVLESVHPNILSVKDLIRIDFAVESVVMEQLEELRRKDLIRQLDSGGFVRHFLDVQTAYKAEEAKEPGENDRMMETSN